MKIAFFDDRFFEVYGAQENVLILAELAQRAGHDSLFITTSNGPLQEEAERRGIPTRVVPAPARLKMFERGATKGGPLRIARSFTDLVTYGPQLHAVLIEEDIEIVLAGAVRASLMLWRTRAAQSPKVVLFAQNSTPFGVFSLASLPGLEVLAPISSGALTTFPAWSKRLWPKQMPLHSGRQLSWYSVDRDDEDTNELRIVSVGALIERKGFHVLLDAIAGLQESGVKVHTRIIGGTSGPDSEIYAASLRQTVAEKSLDVEFTGWQDDVRNELAWANVFVLASSNEGLPGVILEAMASGLPVVATDAGGCKDVVDDEVGALVPIGDAARLQSALATLTIPELRNQRGARAAERVQLEYSLDAFYQRFEDVVNLIASAQVQ